MKICKKCKKHVVNKAKICKYCGADVSKCKILKSQPSNSNSSKNSSSSHTLPSKNIEKKTEDAKLIDSKTIINTKIEENEKKGPKENKKNKEQTDKKKQAAKNTTPKISKKTAEKKIKNKPKQVKKSPKQKQNLKKIFAKATSLLKAKAKKSNVTPKKSKVKTTSPKAKTKKLKNTNQKSKPKKTQSKTKTNVISGLSYKFKNTTSKFFKKLLQILTIIKKFICKTVTTIYLFIKENLKKFKEFIIPILAKISKKIPINKTWIKTHKTALKRCTIVLGIILLLIGISVTSIATYNHFSNHENTVAVGEKATNNKLFSMGDLITYDGVNYKVLSVKTSQGNNYKAPKEGNEFLIVMVYIENNTDHKIKYSYKNWTMSNSKEEEETRIFTSINVDTALYSGDLVIGGIKKGSMVFEQPKNDDKLRLNFYDLTTDEEGNEVIDKTKKIFSVSIKVPEKKKQTQTTLKQDTNSKELD